MTKITNEDDAAQRYLNNIIPKKRWKTPPSREESPDLYKKVILYHVLCPTCQGGGHMSCNHSDRDGSTHPYEFYEYLGPQELIEE